MKRILLVSSLVLGMSFLANRACAQISLQAFGSEGAPLQISGDTTQFLSYGRSNRSSSPLTMLRQQQYQAELDLSEEQIADIQAVQQDIQRQTSEMFRMSAEIGGDGGQLVRQAQTALREKANEKITEILLPHQVKRLNQIRVQSQIQSRGATGLLNDELFSTLRLTDEQKAELAEKNREAQRDLQEQIRKLTERSRNNVLKSVLKPDQLQKLEKLTGDKYETKTPQYRSLGLPSGGTVIRQPAASKK